MSQGRIDWQQVKTLFDAAQPLARGERDAFLRAAAAGDAVRAEVLSLLDHAEQAEADGALALPAALDAAAPARPAPSDAAAALAEPSRDGQRLGAWLVTGILGRGGMGQVLRARRADGAYEAEAAIKLLARGMDSAALLARFAQEQRALARLNHAHIARLYDAGLTADARPYFVMELVEGEPIDRAAQRLDLAERIALFLQLADAVAYAHRQLLVHRDLKPSNVLVDAQGQVKLLDFGIAKAMDTPEGAADLTLTGERPFTPLYASPEQVRGEPVSTATDIYSLGALLYLLLTGTRPTGQGATSAAAAARSVLDEVPVRPSRAAAGSAPAARRELEGDLDNIALKALEKAPEQRYASVDALVADLRAHLEGRPVSARAAQPLYLLAKFVRRNRIAVWTGGFAVLGVAIALVATLLRGRLAAAAGVAMLVAASLAALVQARRAASARDAATRAADDARAQLERVKRITTDLVFRYGDTVTHLPGGARAQEAMLLETVALLEPALQGHHDAELAATMASALGRLAELQGSTTIAARERAAEASATAERALAFAERCWTQCLGDWRFASWHVRTLIVQSQLLRGRGAIHEARAVLELAISRATAALALQPHGDGHLYMGTALGNSHLELAQALYHPVTPSFGDAAGALREYHQAEAALRALLAREADLATHDRKAPPGDQSSEAYLTHQIGAIVASRAMIALRTGDAQQALAEAELAMQLRRRNVERDPRHVWWRHGLMADANVWAQCLLQLGRHAEGLTAATLAWDTMQALARDEGPQSKWARPATQALVGANYGWALLASARPREAAEVLESALAHWRSETGGEAQAKAAQVQQHLDAARAAVAST